MDETPIVVQMAGSSLASAVQAVLALLVAGGIEQEEWTRVLGSAFVAAAVAPHWAPGRSAGEAHDLLKRSDDELADAVEALAPMLLGREMAAQEAARAINEAQRIVSSPELLT